MTEETAKPERDLHSLHAQQMLGAPPGWQWYSLKTLGTTRQRIEHKATHFEMRGAVPVGVYSRGPRKGRPKWPAEKDCDCFIVSFADFRAWAAQYENSKGGENDD